MKKDIREVSEELTDTAKTRAKKLAYLREYRQKRKAEIAAARKARYHSDPEYRKRCIERAKASYRRRKEQMEKFLRDGALPSSSGRKVCPFCKRPMPRTARPARMKVAGKYEVAMFPIGELARRIGRSVRTLTAWIASGIAPDARFKTRSGRRMWTQDEIETYVEVCSSYVLKPPVSYVRSGFSAELKRRLAALKHGIRPELYTVPTPEGLLRRESQELPPAPGTRNRKGVTRNDAGSEEA